MNSKPASCSKCLEQMMASIDQGMADDRFNGFGRDLTQCAPCKKAFADKYRVKLISHDTRSVISVSYVSP